MICLGLHVSEKVSIGDTAGIGLPRHVRRLLSNVIAQVCRLVGWTESASDLQLATLSDVLEELHLILLVLVDGRLHSPLLTVPENGSSIVRLSRGLLLLLDNGLRPL